MASPAPSGKPAVAKPASLNCRTDDEALQLQRWIEFGEDDRPPAVTIEQLSRHLQFLAATLPSKNTDEASGRDRAAVYFRMLGHYTDQAIAYMAKRVCAELDWFPTPHQCLTILAAYEAPTSDKERARMLCRAYWQYQMESFHAALRDGPVDQAIIDAKPDQWKRIAENAGLLRWNDGAFVQRFRPITEQRAEAA